MFSLSKYKLLKIVRTTIYNMLVISNDAVFLAFKVVIKKFTTDWFEYDEYKNDRKLSNILSLLYIFAVHIEIKFQPFIAIL